MVERQILLDAVLVGGIQDDAAAQPAPALGVLGLHQVAAPGALAQDLAAGRDLEPFGGRFLRFYTFWTSHKYLAFAQKRARNIGGGRGGSKRYFGRVFWRFLAGRQSLNAAA